MKTRKFQMAPDHVTALNLVQLEFYGEENVQRLYKTYVGILNGAWPRESDGLERFHDTREDALYDFIHQIALVLDFKMDRQELKRLAYGPQGWHTDEQQWREIRHSLNEVLSGKKALPVIDFNKALQLGNKFPPPPT